VKVDQIVRQVSALQKEVEELRSRLEAFSHVSPSDGSLIGRRLRARGLKLHREAPEDKLIIPPGLSSELTSQFYEKMKRYSFRLFLRDLMKTQGPFSPVDLTHYCSGPVAEEYTRFLRAMATVVDLGRNRYRFNRPGVSSFGPTLEWFVSQMFQREFACPAIFGVCFRETDVGGDYDVLALWEGRLVYAEVKSSPPKSIEGPEVHAFFGRLEDLLPDVAFFFNDTHLRMKDKVLELFRQEMGRTPGPTSHGGAPETLSDEIYHVSHRMYILNSKRDIVGNFRVCLRDHLRKSSHLTVPETEENP
jgi:hypothetical protein